MKLFYVLFTLFIFLSCAEDQTSEQDEKSYIEESFSIKSAETEPFYYLIMENFPTEGGPVISKEPEHAAVSEIGRDENGIYYEYQPEEGFIGTETVEITNHISAGGAESQSQTITRLEIHVKE